MVLIPDCLSRRYQKKAAKLTQEYTASANEVLQKNYIMFSKKAIRLFFYILFNHLNMEFTFIGCARDNLSNENSQSLWNGA